MPSAVPTTNAAAPAKATRKRRVHIDVPTDANGRSVPCDASTTAQAAELELEPAIPRRDREIKMPESVSISKKARRRSALQHCRITRPAAALWDIGSCCSRLGPTMRPPPFLIVLFASALAIEDLEREVEREALGAPGPTRANLRGRGLKFGHSVTEVEEEATDPPVPSPTFAATDPPVPSPTFAATDPPAPAPTFAATDPPVPAPAPAGDFADTQNCADCPDCVVPDHYDYHYLDFTSYDDDGACVCYVGPMKSYSEGDDGRDNENWLYGTDQGDCIAITELTNPESGDYTYILGRGGDDIIVAPTSDWGGVFVFGGTGGDNCVGGDSHSECE